MTEADIWYPYIKPTRYKHDSGFRCFEVGYLRGAPKTEEKVVIGQISDHICQDYMMLVGKTKPFCINMDLTLDGCIRFFSHGKYLVWERDRAGSSMELTLSDTPKQINISELPPQETE